MCAVQVCMFAVKVCESMCAVKVCESMCAVKVCEKLYVLFKYGTSVKLFSVEARNPHCPRPSKAGKEEPGVL